MNRKGFIDITSIIVTAVMLLTAVNITQSNIDFSKPRGLVTGSELPPCNDGSFGSLPYQKKQGHVDDGRYIIDKFDIYNAQCKEFMDKSDVFKDKDNRIKSISRSWCGASWDYSNIDDRLPPKNPPYKFYIRGDVAENACGCVGFYIQINCISSAICGDEEYDDREQVCCTDIDKDGFPSTTGTVEGADYILVDRTENGNECNIDCVDRKPEDDPEICQTNPDDSRCSKNINPNAAEVCYDGVDNNCNGKIDCEEDNCDKKVCEFDSNNDPKKACIEKECKENNPPDIEIESEDYNPFFTVYGDTKSGFSFKDFVNGAEFINHKLYDKALIIQPAHIDQDSSAVKNYGHPIAVGDDYTKGENLDVKIGDEENEGSGLTYKPSDIEDKDLPMTRKLIFNVIDDGVEGTELPKKSSSASGDFFLCIKKKINIGNVEGDVGWNSGKIIRLANLIIAFNTGGIASKVLNSIKTISLLMSSSYDAGVNVKIRNLKINIAPDTRECGVPLFNGEVTMSFKNGKILEYAHDMYKNNKIIDKYIENIGEDEEKEVDMRAKDGVDELLKTFGLSFSDIMPPRPSGGYGKGRNYNLHINVKTTYLPTQKKVKLEVTDSSGGKPRIKYQIKHGLFGKWEDKEFEMNVDTKFISVSDMRNLAELIIKNAGNMAEDDIIDVFSSIVKFDKNEIKIPGVFHARVSYNLDNKDIDLSALLQCCILPDNDNKRNSIYLLRNNESYNDNGIGYQFLPKGFRYMKNISRTFKNKTENETIYRYDESDFRFCNVSVIDSVTSELSRSGGVIETDDVLMEIPEDAIMNTTNITIQKVLINCPSCNDGIKNGNEEGIDCGGSCLTSCISCFDGIKNGDEEGIDCGGSCVIEMQRNEMCGVDENKDCLVTQCEPISECETDSDCSDSCLFGYTSTCAENVGLCYCKEENTCGNNYCEDSEVISGSCPIDCNQSRCNDGIKNQDEIEIDSGGVCCSNGVEDGNEKGIDCGGNCSRTCPGPIMMKGKNIRSFDKKNDGIGRDDIENAIGNWKVNIDSVKVDTKFILELLKNWGM